MLDLVVNDDRLDQSPEGRFLLAIGRAIAGLDIPTVKHLEVSPYPIVGDAKRPSIVVSPIAEELPVDGRMGIYEVDYTASIVMTTDAVGGGTPSMGWQLETRDRLLKRFGGQTAESSNLSEGDDCFATTVRPGVRFDSRAKQLGWLLSRLFVIGRHVDV